MTDITKRPPITRSVIGIAIATALGVLVALAGSSGGLSVGPLPALAMAALVVYGIQWLAFIPAFLSQSERYYDLVGSLTYLSVVGFALSVKGDARSMLLAGLVAIWALRLGSFLFLRIRDAGSDRRFDRIKPFFFRFLMTWTIQGLWVLMTAGAALAAMTSASSTTPGVVAVLGALLWLLGFAIEVAADRQKRQFRRDPANRERFITHGLWAWSRHPNYFGEILLWCGVALIALPALSGWQYLTLSSPLFVYLLLTRISGIPLLDAGALKRWGDDPDYQAYRKATPVLFPRPPRASSAQKG
ncbi:MAG: steroid 5-alpha reductase family enzyme [Halieaceae bacterium]|jgi:steroid 5-alpha reductase family enzyme